MSETEKDAVIDRMTMLIAGLRRRAELMGEIQQLRERLGVLTNDIGSLDRVLQSFGYEGPTDDVPATRTRFVFFHKNELQQHLLYELRRDQRSMTSRDLAVKMVTGDGNDVYDKRLILDVIKRVSKALATLRRRGYISGGRDEKGRYVWKVATSRQRQ